MEEQKPLLSSFGPNIRLNHQTKKSVLSYHNIVFTVQVRKGPCRPRREKVVLDNISGQMNGQMNAILGPTGSGKTTLLDTLAGREGKGNLAGAVLLDGRRLPKNFRCASGYVTQDDVLSGELSVRENLQFSAALRLPSNISSAEKKRRVADLIQELDLVDVADTRVGTEMRRGISGGEKKRTSIGMEIISSPPFLFLDEPTTGLDAYTAVSVMQLLSNLSKTGKTIIFSIHQPRYAIYKLFDTLTILGQGESIYHGSASEAVDYFKRQGYHCDDRENPADYFLDVVRREENGDAGTALASRYRLSSTYKSVQNKLYGVSDLSASYNKEGSDQMYNYQTGGFYQFGVISKRTILNLFRNKAVSVAHWFVAAFIALITGGIYYNVTESDYATGIQNRVGAFFLLTMSITFANTSAVELFIRRRAQFKHESLGGYYRTLPYFFAEIMFELIPFRIFPTTIMSCISYWMIGFSPEIEKFLFFVVTLNLTTLAACSMAFLFSSLISIQALATLFLTLVFVASMIFGGLLINLKHLPNALYWLKFVSIFRYCLEALCINELKDFKVCNYNGSICEKVNANAAKYLKQQDYIGSKWTPQYALAGILGSVLFLAYLRLRFMSKTR